MSIGWSHDSKDPSVEHQVDQLARRPALAHRRRVRAAQPLTDRGPVLVEGGRRRVRSARHLGTVGLEEAQRRPGQGQRTEHRVLDVDQQALARGLVPLVDLVHRRAPCRPGPPTSARRASNGSASQSAKTCSTSSMACSPVGDPLGVGRQTLGRRVDAEALAEPAPQPLAADRDLHRAVAAVEQAVGADRRVVVALRAARPRRRRSTGCPGRRARRRSRRAARSARPCPRRCAPARAGRRAPRRRRTSRPAGRRSARPPVAGRPGPEPVSDISPASPCAIWS